MVECTSGVGIGIIELGSELVWVEEWISDMSYLEERVKQLVRETIISSISTFE
jgi:hypothetical protein